MISPKFSPNQFRCDCPGDMTVARVKEERDRLQLLNESTADALQTGLVRVAG